MKFYLLPSHAQRRRKNGDAQPHRIFLADGTEIRGASRIEGQLETETTVLHSDGKAEYVTRCTRLTLEFTDPVLVTVTKRPRRTARKA